MRALSFLALAILGVAVAAKKEPKVRNEEACEGAPAGRPTRAPLTRRLLRWARPDLVWPAL